MLMLMLMKCFGFGFSSCSCLSFFFLLLPRNYQANNVPLRADWLRLDVSLSTFTEKVTTPSIVELPIDHGANAKLEALETMAGRS